MSFETLIQEIKATVVKYGTCPPTLSLELLEPYEFQIFDLLELNDHMTILEQAGFLFQKGREEGVKHKGQKLASITFVAETWSSKSNVLKNAINPKNDKNRQEHVIIEIWSKDKGTVAHVMDIKRKKDGSIISIEEPRILKRHIGSEQTEAFRKGFVSQDLTDEELSKLLGTMIRERVKKL